MQLPRHATALTLASALLLGGCASRSPLPTFYDFGPPAPLAAQAATPPVPMLVIADAKRGDIGGCDRDGVACHEAGHALQYAQGYAPIKLRAAIIPATNIGSKLAMPLVILGLIMSYYAQAFISVAYIGIIFFAACVFFQLVTLPVEFNASHRALMSIEGQGMLNDEELKG